MVNQSLFMQKKVEVSIVIVNYRIKKELFECIGSIYRSKPKLEFEIIVVDNDEIKTIEKDLLRKFPKVKYIKNRGNIGYGAGNNLGARFASGEFLFILNPDTKIISGNLSDLINSAKKEKKVGAVAPLLIDGSRKPYDLQGTKELTPKRAIFSLSFLSKIWPRNKIRKNYYNLSWNKKTVKEVDIVPGTAFVIKRTLFEDIGGFDEKFFLYFEEFDLCRRIRKLRYKNFIVPKVKIYHKGSKVTAKRKSVKNK